MSGWDLIRQERERQVGGEGWTAEHDDGHAAGELVIAAACYAVAGLPPRGLRYPVKVTTCGNDAWPWGEQFDNRGRNKTQEDRVRLLVKAGALIAAEIDRIDRLRRRGS